MGPRSVLLAFAVASVAASGAPDMLRTQSQVFSTGNINKVAAMDTDGSFIYTATYGQIIKENKMNMHDFGVLNLAEMQYADVGTLRVDGDNIFVTASKVGGGQYLLRVDKATMTVAHTHKFSESQNMAFAMALDADHVYTGMYTQPGRIIKLKKSTLAQESELTLAAGEHDVRSLMWSTTDATHLYANCNTSPGRIVRVKLLEGGGLLRTGATTLSAGDNKILAGVATDGEFLYVGTDTTPGKLVKIKKADMSLVATLQLEAGEDQVISMISDSDFLYAGTLTSPGKVVRVRRTGFVRVDALTLSTDENSVSAMTHGNGRVFVGLDTSPARIVQLSGYLEPVDCILSDWGQWSVCDKTCAGGQQHRSRTVHTAAKNGGAACAANSDGAADLAQTQACSADIVCPVHCEGGQIWMAGSGTLPVRTCANRDPLGVTSGHSHCQCPPHKPFWHADSFCASTKTCEKQVTTLCLDSDLTCKVEAGRLILERHSNRNIQDFHCRHHAQSQSDNSCRCLCRIGSATE
jgi:hypothetical protein